MWLWSRAGCSRHSVKTTHQDPDLGSFVSGAENKMDDKYPAVVRASLQSAEHRPRYTGHLLTKDVSMSRIAEDGYFYLYLKHFICISKARHH